MHKTLISPAELTPHLGDSRWVVVDCRFDLTDPGWGEEQYLAGHIPGARYAHLDRELSGTKTGTNGRHPLPTIDEMAAQFGAMGIGGGNVTDWRLYDTHYTERYLGQPDANATGYEASAVMPYVGNLRAPLLVMHGMADDNVLFTHSTRLFSVLQKLNKPFDAMTYPGSKHGLLRHADTGLHGYTMVARFFEPVWPEWAHPLRHLS